MHTEFWWGNPREGDSLEDSRIKEGILLLKCIIKKQDWLMWNGLIWLRIETGDVVVTR